MTDEISGPKTAFLDPIGAATIGYLVLIYYTIDFNR